MKLIFVSIHIKVCSRKSQVFGRLFSVADERSGRQNRPCSKLQAQTSKKLKMKNFIFNLVLNFILK
jgi:hypothetical protein